MGNPIANATNTQTSVIIWLALPVKSATAVEGREIIEAAEQVEANKATAPATNAPAPTAYLFIVENINLRGQ